MSGTTWHYVAQQALQLTTHCDVFIELKTASHNPTCKGQDQIRLKYGIKKVNLSLPHCHIATFPGCIEITSVTIAESKLCYIFFVDKRDSYTFCKMNWGSNKHHRAKSPWLYQQK